MIIYSFKYTKADGTTSRRVLAPFALPNKFFAGNDITELSTEEQALYITEVDAAKTRYAQELAQINSKFDVEHRYRQFNPDQMTNVKHEDI